MEIPAFFKVRSPGRPAVGGALRPEGVGLALRGGRDLVEPIGGHERGGKHEGGLQAVFDAAHHFLLKERPTFFLGLVLFHRVDLLRPAPPRHRGHDTKDAALGTLKRSGRR